MWEDYVHLYKNVEGGGVLGGWVLSYTLHNKLHSKILSRSSGTCTCMFNSTRPSNHMPKLDISIYSPTIFILAGNKDLNKRLDELKIWQDPTSY